MKRLLALICQLTILLLPLHACSDDNGNAYKPLITEKPTFEWYEGTYDSILKSPPPEKIANFILENYAPPGKGEGVKQCVAYEIAKKIGDSDCLGSESEMDEAECAYKKGYWRHKVSRAFSSHHMDLNGDGIQDYIVSWGEFKYCTDFSHNYTNTFLIILSDKGNKYHIGLVVNATELSVLQTKENNAPIIRASTMLQNGDIYEFFAISGDKYIARACFHPSSHNNFKAVRCKDAKYKQ